MKFFALLGCLAVSALAFGQPALKMVKTKSRYLVEQYDVLTSQDTVRTGPYRRYFREGNALLEEGQYTANRRTGRWTFYDRTGKPELTYDYSASKVLTNTRAYLDSTGIIQQAGKDVVVPLTPSPVCLVSMYQVMSILMRESRFPAHLQRAGITQLSYQIVATVSPAGVHYRVILSHTDKEFYQIAYQATLLAFKDVQWLPGVHEGREVTVMYALPAVVLHGFSTNR